MTHAVLVLLVVISSYSCGTGETQTGGSDPGAPSLSADATPSEVSDSVALNTDIQQEVGNAVDAELQPTDEGSVTDVGGPPPFFFGGPRPAPYFLPESYDPAVPMPVLVLLHGYTATGTWTANWWQLHTTADEAGILLIVPEGTVNPGGAPFWNATEFCCNFYGAKVDDVEYVTSLIEEATTYFSVDPARVFLMGHSNGGFMSHRIACDRADLIAAIVNMGGSTWYSPDDCGNPDPVSILQVHGTWDTSIFYGGLQPNVGDPNAPPIDIEACLLDSCEAPYNACAANAACTAMGGCFESCTTTADPDTCKKECWDTAGFAAQILWMDSLTCGVSAGCYLEDPTKDSFGYASVDEGAARWAQINGCSSMQVDTSPMDLVTEIPGNDTYPRTYENCPTGRAVDTWKIVYGSHVPGFNDNWAPAVMNWLLAQSKPVP